MDEIRERTENQPDDMNTDNDQEGRDKEILLKNLEAVRQQVAELQARLESIRREQLRLQRQFQYDQVHFLYKNLGKYQNDFLKLFSKIFF